MRFRPIRGRGRYVRIGDSEWILTLRYRLADHGGWLENCAYCTEYACGKLETFFSTETTAKTRLEAIRSRIL